MISDPVERAVQDLSKLLKPISVMSSDSLLVWLRPIEFNVLERERQKQSLYHQVLGKCSLNKGPQLGYSSQTQRKN